MLLYIDDCDGVLDFCEYSAHFQLTVIFKGDVEQSVVLHDWWQPLWRKNRERKACSICMKKWNCGWSSMICAVDGNHRSLFLEEKNVIFSASTI